MVAQPGDGFVVFGMGVTLANARIPAIWRFDATGAQIGTSVTLLNAAANDATLHATANGFMIIHSDRTPGVDQAFVQTFTGAGAPIGAPQFLGQTLTKEMDVAKLANGKLALILDSNSGAKSPKAPDRSDHRTPAPAGCSGRRCDARGRGAMC